MNISQGKLLHLFSCLLRATSTNRLTLGSCGGFISLRLAWIDYGLEFLDLRVNLVQHFLQVFFLFGVSDLSRGDQILIFFLGLNHLLHCVVKDLVSALALYWSLRCGNDSSLLLHCWL